MKQTRPPSLRNGRYLGYRQKNQQGSLHSSVDGLVAYDYATPGFTAFGYTPEKYCHIEKPERANHRERIIREIRNHMPVLGINLRVAPEWGVICGYGKDGEDLFCRTKYDRQTIDNDPVFMRVAECQTKQVFGKNICPVWRSLLK